MSELTEVQELEDVGHSNELTVDEAKLIYMRLKFPCAIHVELRHPINRGKERINYHLINVDDPDDIMVGDNGDLVIHYQDDRQGMIKTIPSGQWLEKTVRLFPPVEMPPEEKEASE